MKWEDREISGGNIIAGSPRAIIGKVTETGHELTEQGKEIYAEYQNRPKKGKKGLDTPPADILGTFGENT